MQYKYYEISDPFAFVFTKANGKTQSISFIISIRRSQHGNKIKNNAISIKSNKVSLSSPRAYIKNKERRLQYETEYDFQQNTDRQ